MRTNSKRFVNISIPNVIIIFGEEQQIAQLSGRMLASFVINVWWRSMGREIFMDKRHYFHLCADGNKARNFILGKADFIAVMNIVAVCAANTNVTIVAFSLEDTHPHFLLYGTVEECGAFKDLFESTCIRYACRTRNGSAEFELKGEFYPVDDDIAHLRNVAAYVVIQPTKDGKRVMPYDYLWGSGSLYFRNHVHYPVWSFDDNGVFSEPVRFDSLSVQERREMSHSRKYTVPGDWLVAGGVVMPTNYIDIAGFEAIFQTPNCFRVFLSGNKHREEELLQQMSQQVGVSLEDTEARSICSTVCKEMFGIRDVRRLDTRSRVTLAQSLRSRYRISFRQLSALVLLPESEVRKYVPR